VVYVAKLNYVADYKIRRRLFKRSDKVLATQDIQWKLQPTGCRYL